MSPDSALAFAKAEAEWGRLPAGARHARILELVARDGFVSVAEVAETFAVSDMTIRRDLRCASKTRACWCAHMAAPWASGGARGVRRGRAGLLQPAAAELPPPRRRSRAPRPEARRPGGIDRDRRRHVDAGARRRDRRTAGCHRVHRVQPLCRSDPRDGGIARCMCSAAWYGAPELSVVGSNPIKQLRQFHVDNAVPRSIRRDRSTGSSIIRPRTPRSNASVHRSGGDKSSCCATPRSSAIARYRRFAISAASRN